MIGLSNMTNWKKFFVTSPFLEIFDSAKGTELQLDTKELATKKSYSVGKA